MSLVKKYQFIRDKLLLLRLQREHRQRVKTHSPNYVLTQEQADAVRQYYAPYAKVDLGAHNFYTDKTGTFCVDYMPDDLYYCYIDQFYNDWREVRYADNKCFYRRMFTGVQQPVELASRINGFWYTGDFNRISRQELNALLEKEPEIVVKKALGSEGGKGVYFVPGNQLETVEKNIIDDIVIQRPICQHEALSAINSTSVNTIRVLSLLTEEGVKVYSAILRMGIHGARVDNASSGGITCGITWDGKLKKNAYTASGICYDKHMDSGVVFENYQIPGFTKCLDAVKQLHIQVPRFRLVSWDFSIDQQGEPVLIEANLHYGQLDFHQLNNGPIFGEDTHKILQEVFGQKK